VTEFRGFPACSCQVEWLPVFERTAQRLGILTGSLHLFQLIGGNVRSGGTHLTGGAADWFHTTGLVALARQMGADATWHRPFNWDGKGGNEHDHSVLRGCPHLSASAAAQIVAVDHNGDGLVGDVPDPGPRPLSGRTWREGIAWAQEEELMATAEEKIADIVRGLIPDIVEAVLDAEVEPDLTLRRAVRRAGKPAPEVATAIAKAVAAELVRAR